MSLEDSKWKLKNATECIPRIEEFVYAKYQDSCSSISDPATYKVNLEADYKDVLNLHDDVTLNNFATVSVEKHGMSDGNLFGCDVIVSLYTLTYKIYSIQKDRMAIKSHQVNIQSTKLSRKDSSGTSLSISTNKIRQFAPYNQLSLF